MNDTPTIEQLARKLYVWNEAETGAMTWDELLAHDGANTVVAHYRAIAREWVSEIRAERERVSVAIERLIELRKDQIDGLNVLGDA